LDCQEELIKTIDIRYGTIFELIPVGEWLKPPKKFTASSEEN